MFNWYTNKKYIIKKNYKQCIFDIDSEFLLNYTKYTSDKQIILEALKLDHSILLKQDLIETFYGVTTLEKLATGIKAYIIVRYIMKHCKSSEKYLISFIEVGDNVISCIVPMLNGCRYIDIYDNKFIECQGKLNVKINNDRCINSFAELECYLCE